MKASNNFFCLGKKKNINKYQNCDSTVHPYMEYVEQVRSLNVDKNKKNLGKKKKKTKLNEIYKEHFLIKKKKTTIFKEIQWSVKFETRKDNLISEKNRKRGK